MAVLTARAYVHASYDDVWNCFTSAPAYAAWASAPCTRFPQTPGETIAWGAPARAVYTGTLERIEKGRGLRHTFRFEGFGFDEPPTPVEIGIAAQGDTVLVTIVHDCSGAPQTAAMIGPLGWLKSLSRLKTLLETGRAMPWPEE
jgi:hypothetical protein